MNKKQIRPLARLHGYWIYHKLLKQSAHWDEAQRRQYIFDHLRKTLVDAKTGSPFYQKRFQAAGFDPERDFRSPTDLAKIPILTKEEARANYDAMLDKRFLSTSVEANTSGTTGEPMKMRLGLHYIAFDYGCMYRHWAKAGYTFRASYAALRSYVPGGPNEPLWKYNFWQNTLYMSAYHLSPANCQQYVDEILKLKPKYIRGYPSSLNVFAEYAYPQREKFSFVRGLFTASETLLPSERDTIERTFGKKLYDWYGMTEPVLVITEAADHRGMEINWEYGYAELLSSPELPPNEYRLIATSFHNPVMPFIRYDTGDIVRLPANAPAPGYYDATPPLIEAIVGRKDESIIMPDGRRLPSLNFYSVFRDFTDILKFQIVQFGRSEILVKVVMRPNVQNQPLVLKSLRNELLLRFGDDISLDIEVTEKFLTNRDGKTPPVVRKPGNRAVEEVAAYASSTQAAWKMEREKLDLAKLDYNEADIGPSPLVRQTLRELVENDRYFHWYPETETEELQKTLAAYCEVKETNLLLTHGSDMVIELVATAFMRYGDKILMVNPTYEKVQYMMEERGAVVAGLDYFGEGPFPLQALLEKIRSECPRLLYFSNPNNPIGYSLPLEAVSEIARVCEEMSCIFLHDEAYFEFCGVTAAKLLGSNKSIVVSRTFSKAFGLAGLRLGYLMAHEDVLPLLKRVHNTNHVTMLAKAAGLAALRDLDYTRAYIKEVNENKVRVQELLKRLNVTTYPSYANYLLVRCADAKGLTSFLKDRRIFVRDKTRTCNNIGHVRITIGGRQSSDYLLQCLEEYFTKVAVPQR